MEWSRPPISSRPYAAAPAAFLSVPRKRRLTAGPCPASGYPRVPGPIGTALSAFGVTGIEPTTRASLSGGPALHVGVRNSTATESTIAAWDGGGSVNARSKATALLGPPPAADSAGMRRVRRKHNLRARLALPLVPILIVACETGQPPASAPVSASTSGAAGRELINPNDLLADASR